MTITNEVWLMDLSLLFFFFFMIKKSGFFFFFWRLFELKSLCVLLELKSLFLDFGRMEKMVGLSSDRW